MKNLVTNVSAAEGIASILREHRALAVKSDGKLHIDIPLPDHACHPNARCHWRKKASAVKSIRNSAHLSAIGCGFFFKAAVVEAKFYCTTKRKRDRDGAISSLKGAMDGLTDAGVWEDDNCVHWGDVEFYVDAEYPRVALTIYERNK